MLYSSGMLLVFQAAKSLLEHTSATLLPRKIETSDPKEVNEQFLKSALGASFGGEESQRSGASTPAQDEQKPMFARPKGPARKR
jgi:twinfilin